MCTQRALLGWQGRSVPDLAENAGNCPKQSSQAGLCAPRHLIDAKLARSRLDFQHLTGANKGLPDVNDSEPRQSLAPVATQGLVQPRPRADRIRKACDFPSCSDFEDHFDKHACPANRADSMDWMNATGSGYVSSIAAANASAHPDRPLVRWVSGADRLWFLISAKESNFVNRHLSPSTRQGPQTCSALLVLDTGPVGPHAAMGRLLFHSLCILRNRDSSHIQDDSRRQIRFPPGLKRCIAHCEYACSASSAGTHIMMQICSIAHMTRPNRSRTIVSNVSHVAAFFLSILICCRRCWTPSLCLLEDPCAPRVQIETAPTHKTSRIE